MHQILFLCLKVATKFGDSPSIMGKNTTVLDLNIPRDSQPLQNPEIFVRRFARRRATHPRRKTDPGRDLDNDSCLFEMLRTSFDSHG
jgi:hypothetical protein